LSNEKGVAIMSAMDPMHSLLASLVPRNTLDFLEKLAAILNALFLVFLPIELFRQYKAGSLNRQRGLEMAANVFPLLPTLLTQGMFTVVILWLFRKAAAHALFTIPTTGWSALVAILLVDFMYYWEHRIAHRVRLVWAATHSVHHSSPVYDQTTGLRVSFADAFYSPWFYLPIVAMGFDPMLVLAAFSVVVSYQQWIHTETIGRLGWFDRWFNSPSNHRVHHASQPLYLDKNYGGVLIVWDRIFGTYASETEAPHYGLTTPIGSVNPWVVHTAELRALISALRGRKPWRARLRLLFGGPEQNVTD
jgi:sterol desaturase/sphingolipid hydroxylase (fatty acid hydroxylase superfamily)